MPKRNPILYLSLLLNLIAIFFFVRRAYYAHQYNETILKQNTTKAPHLLNRQTIFDLFPIQTGDIVFAGDSHTFYFPVDEFFKGVNIKNRGIGNEASAQLLERIDQIAKGGPAKVFLQIGFNDLRKHIKQDGILKNIRLMVSRIKSESPRCKIYILSVFPMSGSVNNVSDEIIDLNEAIANYCSVSELTYLDLYNPLSDGDSLNNRFNAGDGIHLNGQGYLVWSKVIKPYLH